MQARSYSRQVPTVPRPNQSSEAPPSIPTLPHRGGLAGRGGPLQAAGYMVCTIQHQQPPIQPPPAAASQSVGMHVTRCHHSETTWSTRPHWLAGTNTGAAQRPCHSTQRGSLPCLMTGPGVPRDTQRSWHRSSPPPPHVRAVPHRLLPPHHNSIISGSHATAAQLATRPPTQAGPGRTPPAATPPSVRLGRCMPAKLRQGGARTACPSVCSDSVSLVLSSWPSRKPTGGMQQLQ